jgi:hypothetical protein
LDQIVVLNAGPTADIAVAKNKHASDISLHNVLRTPAAHADIAVHRNVDPATLGAIVGAGRAHDLAVASNQRADDAVLRVIATNTADPAILLKVVEHPLVSQATLTEVANNANANNVVDVAVVKHHLTAPATVERVAGRTPAAKHYVIEAARKVASAQFNLLELPAEDDIGAAVDNAIADAGATGLVGEGLLYYRFLLESAKNIAPNCRSINNAVKEAWDLSYKGANCVAATKREYDKVASASLPAAQTKLTLAANAYGRAAEERNKLSMAVTAGAPDAQKALLNIFETNHETLENDIRALDNRVQAELENIRASYQRVLSLVAEANGYIAEVNTLKQTANSNGLAARVQTLQETAQRLHENEQRLSGGTAPVNPIVYLVQSASTVAGPAPTSSHSSQSMDQQKLQQAKIAFDGF